MDSDNQVTYSGEPSQKKFGPIIATLVVILILIIAALWLFASKSNEEPIPTGDNGAAGIVEEGTVQPVTNTSTEPADLQSDLNASVEGLENI